MIPDIWKLDFVIFEELRVTVLHIHKIQYIITFNIFGQLWPPLKKLYKANERLYLLFDATKLHLTRNFPYSAICMETMALRLFLNVSCVHWMLIPMYYPDED